MEKAKVRPFSGVFLKLINLSTRRRTGLAAVICIVCLLAPIKNSGIPNEQEKSNISIGNSPIILLSTTIADVEGKDSFVFNEPKAGKEPEPQSPEKVQTKPENATNPQPDDSENNEGNTESPEEWESIEMRVTAYCPCPRCCGEYSDGITACGYEIQPGDTFVAADRRYPFGTEMLIPGYSNSRTVKVLDRGGAIKGNRLDVFFASHQEALEWGVKYLGVQVRREKL